MGDKEVDEPWLIHPTIPGVRAQRLGNTIKVEFDIPHAPGMRIVLLSEILIMPIFEMPRLRWTLVEQFIYIAERKTCSEMILTIDRSQQDTENSERSPL